MKHEINTFELSDEQLEAVAGGGSQSNYNGQANLSGVNQQTAVIGSALFGSPVANNGFVQNNVNSQSNNSGFSLF